MWSTLYSGQMEISAGLFESLRDPEKPLTHFGSFDSVGSEDEDRYTSYSESTRQEDTLIPTTQAPQSGT